MTIKYMYTNSTNTLHKIGICIKRCNSPGVEVIAEQSHLICLVHESKPKHNVIQEMEQGFLYRESINLATDPCNRTFSDNIFVREMWHAGRILARRAKLLAALRLLLRSGFKFHLGNLAFHPSVVHKHSTNCVLGLM